MQPLTETKFVLVVRPTRLAELVARYNTLGQARFYLEHLGADFSDYQREDEQYGRALREAQRLLSRWGRLQVVERRFLPNFLFGPHDIVLTLGQDGLVANTMKYLQGQPLLGVNPDPQRWDGQLLPFRVGELGRLIPEVLAGQRPTREVTMAKATVNAHQTIYAVNDLFIGIRSHGSARYRIRFGDVAENHSSSGVIVSTGLGSTGWLRSLLTGAARINRSASDALGGTTAPDRPSSPPAVADSPRPKEDAAWRIAWDAEFLCFTVREPFPSQRTGCELVFGKVTANAPLCLESYMPEHGVVFSDGIEQDALEFNAGARAVITLADRKGRLVL